MSIALLQEDEQLAAEHTAEHTDGQEEITFGSNLAGAVERQSAGRNEAMQVGMMTQVLRPGVQHREHAYTSAEMARIGGDLQQGLGSGTEQQVVKQTLVAECERRQLLGHRKDDMCVGHQRRERTGYIYEWRSYFGKSIIVMIASITSSVNEPAAKVSRSIWFNLP